MAEFRDDAGSPVTIEYRDDQGNPVKPQGWADTFSDVFNLPRRLLTPSEGSLGERAGGAIIGGVAAGPAGALAGGLHPKQTIQIARTVGRYGAPIAGGLGGAVAGAAVGGPGGAVVGEVAGSALGETVGQAIGGEGFDPLQVLLSGAIPVAARGVARAATAIARPIIRALPGTSEWLHEMAHAQMWGTVKEMTDSLGNIDDAWDKARALGRGIKVPTVKVRDTLSKLKTDEDILKALGAGDKQLHGFLTKLDEGVGQMDSVPFKWYDALRQRIGAYSGKVEAGGGPRWGAAKKLYRAMMDGYDDAIDVTGQGVTPAIEALREARGLTKITNAFTELKDILNTKVVDTLADGTVYLKIKPLQQQLRLNEELRHLGAQHINRLRVFADEMGASLPKSPATGLAGPGSLAVASAGATVGAGVGLTVAGAPGALIGGGIGILAGPRMLRGVVDKMSRMMLTEPGRAFLAQTLKTSGGLINEQKMTAIMQFPRVGLAEILADQPTPKLRTREQRPDKPSELERMFFGRGAK